LHTSTAGERDTCDGGEVAHHVPLMYGGCCGRGGISVQIVIASCGIGSTENLLMKGGLVQDIVYQTRHSHDLDFHLGKNRPIFNTA